MATGPDIITALNADADLDRCAVISGSRNQRATDCVGVPAVEGGAPQTDHRFLVCSAHAHLLIDPHPIAS
jgi:hypothetical protein